MSYLERAITDGHAKFSGEGKQQAVPAPNGGASVSRAAFVIGKFGGADQLHVAVNHAERYADPEEQVRAGFWTELNCHKHRLGRADLLVSQMAAPQRLSQNSVTPMSWLASNK